METKYTQLELNFPDNDNTKTNVMNVIHLWENFIKIKNSEDAAQKQIIYEMGVSINKLRAILI